jgi:hypothetical protein
MRILPIALAALTTLGLAGCGGEAGPPRTVAPTETPSSAPTATQDDAAALKTPRAIATH